MPYLATFPSIFVWVAGCGTGEEAHSIAILLAEAGLLARSMIYATDIDAPSLRIAESATYPLARLPKFAENYVNSGGSSALTEHMTTANGRIVFDPGFREHLHFADHSLATDAPFAEVQLVSCRNVLIYFDQELQNRALGVCHDSLCSRGFLGLGSTETLQFSAYATAFEVVAPPERIYRLK
jgi:chemotaxis protein methyltransferase CheR